jgi:hypothetical protein
MLVFEMKAKPVHALEGIEQFRVYNHYLPTSATGFCICWRRHLLRIICEKAESFVSAR